MNYFEEPPSDDFDLTCCIDDRYGAGAADKVEDLFSAPKSSNFRRAERIN